MGADDPDVVLLCVPDTAIADVSRCLTPGRAWVGTCLRRDAARRARAARAPVQPPSAADVHRSGDPSSSTAPGAAITGETDQALAVARELAETLGLHPFELADGARTLYHAGAVFASNYVVTLQRAASLLFEAAGARRRRSSR